MKPVFGTVLAMSLLGSGASASAAPPGPAATVDAFHAAMQSGRADAAVKLMLPEALIFEQGFFEASRDDYTRSHLGDDVTFAAATRREVLARETVSDGATAWVLSRTRTRGEIGGRDVDLTGTETMLLRRAPEGWRILHIHWSAHPTPPPAPAEAAPPAGDSP